MDLCTYLLVMDLGTYFMNYLFLECVIYVSGNVLSIYVFVFGNILSIYVFVFGQMPCV